MSATSINKFFFPVGILVAVLLVFSGLFQADFINWDDGFYITDNRDVASFNIKNYFTHFYVGNYQPVTMLVYGLVYKISGDQPVWFHVLNVLVHAANGILLFSVCRYFLSFGPSAFISLVFCFHPVQVENVAWASELKTLLCVHFYLWAFVFYYRFTLQQRKKHYALSFMFFVLACLSKPIAVTFPALMLLYDACRNHKITRSSVLNALPFFALSLGIGLLSYYATRSGGFMSDVQNNSMGDKLIYAGNALSSYLALFAAPYRLSVIYPYPEMSVPVALGGILTVLVYAAILWLTYKKNRLVFFALLFFLIHTVIYLQFISFGEVLLADRYLYLALPALVYLLVLLGQWLTKNKMALTATGIALVLVCAGLAWKRTLVWTNNKVFWADLLDKFPESHVALSSMGAIHLQEKEYKQAAELLDRAITFNAAYAPAHYNKGLLLVAINRPAEALTEFTSAIALHPSPKYLLARARVYYLQRQLQEALADVDHVPDDINAVGLKAMIYDDMGKHDIALTYYNQVLAHHPNRTELILRRGILYGKVKRFDDAIRDFTHVIETRPQSGEAYYWRAVARFSTGQSPCADLKEAVNRRYGPATKAFDQFCKNHQ